MKIFKCDVKSQLKAQRNRHSKRELRDLTASKSETREKLWSSVFEKHFVNAQSVLAIGARDDSEVRFFEEKGLRCMGIDVSVSTDYIRQMDCHDLRETFDEDQFDVAFCSHVLEHCYGAKSVLTQVRQVARLGAVVVLPTTRTGQKMSIQHPTIFDVMKSPSGEICVESPLLVDFKSFLPYKLIYHEALHGEVALAFSWEVDV